MKRVLYIQRPNGGGSATGLVDLIRGVDRKRYQPIVLFYAENSFVQTMADLGAETRVLQAPSRKGIPEPIKTSVTPIRRRRSVREVNRLLRRDLPLAKCIAAVIRETRAEIVHHNNNLRSDCASIIGAWMARIPQISHVRFFHDYFRPIDRRVARLPNYFIYMSRAVEAECHRELLIPTTRGRVIYDGFDFEVPPPAPAAAAIRRELSVAPGERLVANVGRLVPWKGQDVFIRAFAHVAQAIPGIRAVLVGSAPENEQGQRYERHLRELAADLSVADRIVFTGFRSDVPAIMAAADLCVHSSSEPEPFGRVIVEAMSLGRPVIATAAGGVLDIIEDHRTGRLVALKDSAAMAGAMEDLLRDPAAAVRIGTAARIDVRERFTIPRHLAAVQALYDRLTGSPVTGAVDTSAYAQA